MTPLLSWMMLILAGIIAYLIAYIFNYFSKKLKKTEAKEIKKIYLAEVKSDFDKYKAVEIVKAAQSIGIDSGLDEESAFKSACIFCEELAQKGLINEKYRMLRGA